MRCLRNLAVALATTAFLVVAGCDFHEEPPPLEGQYEPRRFDVAFGDSTIDVLSAGGRVEMTFQRNGDQRRVNSSMVIPEGTLFANQSRIDTTLSGSYFMIVDRVTIDFGQGSIPMPTSWLYEDGILRSQGFFQIELTKQ